MEAFVYFTPLALVLSFAAYTQVSSLRKEVEQLKARLDKIHPAK